VILLSLEDQTFIGTFSKNNIQFTFRLVIICKYT